MKKILIFYATYGNGHLSAAKSIKQYIDQNYKEYETELVDCVEFVNKALNLITSSAYNQISKNAPWAWKKVYYRSQKGALSAISSTSNKFMALKLLKLFKQYNPDLVISTHPFGTQMTAFLKRKHKVKCKLATIMTDFAPHKQWLVDSDYSDYFFVAHTEMKNELIKTGIEDTKIFPTGIPISPKFWQEYNKDEIYKEFNLDKTKKLILLFGGGSPILVKNKLLEVLETLTNYTNKYQIIAIAGRYEKCEKDFNEIAKKHNYKGITVLGFTNKVPELMNIADLSITKPGGLTSSECLACKVPMILINPIPGQEEENAEFLENSGAAIWIKKESDIADILNNLLSSPEKLEIMKQNTKILAKPHSTKNICDTILKSEI